MPFPLAISFAVGTLMAVTTAGISAPVTGARAGSVGLTTAAAVGPLSASGAETTATLSPRTRLEVWASPSRIAKIKRGRSRSINATAMETMAEWREVKAVISARTTAGRITPKRTQSSKLHPAQSRLTRTSGSTFGFVTLTATTRKYGTATRVVSWGPVRLPRTLTGTLAHVDHWQDASNGLVSDKHEEWNVTFRLVSRSSGEWMGAAVYQLSGGTWSAGSSESAPDLTCVGQGSGRALAGSLSTLRYDWRGATGSTGAGEYWIDVTSTDNYLTRCVSGNQQPYYSSSHPRFTYGFKPATGGVHPDHLKGKHAIRLEDDYETWTWNLSAP